MEDFAFKANDVTNITRAMSFQLPENQTAYLYSTSLYLLHFPFEPPGSPINLNISLFNATSTNVEGKTVPIPDVLLFSKTVNFPLITGPIGWKDFAVDSFELNPEIITYDNTFFISLTNATELPKAPAIVGGTYRVFWFFAPDNNGTGSDGSIVYENRGYAFYYNDTTSMWEPEYSNVTGSNVTIDYCLRVRLSVSNETSYWDIPLPTSVNMNVNGTAVLSSSRGEGLCSLSGILNISGNLANLYVNTSWLSPLTFDVTIEVYGVDVLGMLYMSSLTTFFAYNFVKDKQDKFFLLLGLIAVGAVATSGYSGWTTYKKRRIPLNAMKSLENILVDHNVAGTLIWSFDFVSMQQDVALISGFMSAIKSFLEEMKIGGLKRLSTEFGTFIREESELLTATIITSDIKLEEELWIRNKLHEFLIKIEQSHYEQLKDWKGDVAQFRESFSAILSSLINLEKVQSLQREKIEKLTRNKNKLQEKVNRYGVKLEELKSRYDSGELDFKRYIVERYKTEAKYDKVQKEYIYAGLFLSRTTALLEAKPMKAKEVEKMEKIQNRFLEIRKEIEELQKKELEGSITSQDLERKESLQKELMTLMEKLDKLKKT